MNLALAWKGVLTLAIIEIKSLVEILVPSISTVLVVVSYPLILSALPLVISACKKSTIASATLPTTKLYTAISVLTINDLPTIAKQPIKCSFNDTEVNLPLVAVSSLKSSEYEAVIPVLLSSVPYIGNFNSPLTLNLVDSETISNLSLTASIISLDTDCGIIAPWSPVEKLLENWLVLTAFKKSAFSLDNPFTNSALFSIFTSSFTSKFSLLKFSTLIAVSYSAFLFSIESNISLASANLFSAYSLLAFSFIEFISFIISCDFNILLHPFIFTYS